MMRKLLITAFLIMIITHAHADNRSDPLTKGFHHVGLSVLNLEASTQFFINTLGWTLKGRDQSYPAAFISDGNMLITLWQVTSPQTAAKFDRKNNVGLHHLAIAVKSAVALDVLYKKFKKIPNVIIEFAPELAYGGPDRHMMIREPSGNRLEFRFSPSKKT